MKCIPLIDNRSHAIKELKYFKTEEKISEEDINSLKEISQRTLKNIIENDNLLIFPSDLNSKNIEENKTIFNIYNNEIRTNNIMGFIGYNDTQIKITSRFASDKEDYFLHYMLQKVLCFNIFDLQHSSDKDNSFDFLIYMFIHFFQKAIRQGIYKSYQKREYNDANVRGVIDINRHIRKNIPFGGKIAYRMREYSYDNNLTQLIRHTIEYINSKNRGILNINEELKISILQMIEATSSYDKNKRQNIINKNLKKLNHPYFYEYEPLRKICVQILRHEEIKYGREEDKIYGILFDGAYLWEEYIWTILKDLDFKHPQNKLGTDGINLLDNGWRVYPDFYNDNKKNNNNKIVLDTKYKRLNRDNENIDSNDKHQIISYVYTLGAQIGGFVYPCEGNFGCNKETIGTIKNNINHNASICKYAFLIPNINFNNIKEFSDEIKKSEKNLKKIYDV